MLQRVLTIMVAVLLGWGASATAQFLDPALKWQTIETPHFRVVFHAGSEGMAQLTAQAAEEAWNYWKEKLGYAPAGKVEVVVVDYTDAPNGFANLQPNNEFVNFTSYNGFAGGFANSESPSWEDLVTFHEYGHIADLDFVSGLSKTLRGVFGRTVVPGIAEPTLLIEGIPTYGEFRYRGASRANDARVAMMLRAMMLENNFPDYQEASFYYARDQWPAVGSISHDVGPWFLRYLEDSYGEDTYQKLKIAQTSDPFWAIGSLVGLSGDFNSVYQKVLGKSGEALWDEFKVWVNQQFGEQVSQIQEAGITTSRQLSNLGYLSTAAVWSPDGQWVYYGHNDPQRAGGLRRVRPDGSGDQPFLQGAGNFTFLPEGRGAVFTRGDVYEKFYQRNDLYYYDFETGQETRLTHGERAFSVSVTPDGNSVIYARNNWGEQTPSLSRLDLDSGQISEIQAFPADTSIESMALSPDGQTVALSIYKRGGYLDIYTLPASGGELTPVTQDLASDSQPTWSPDGQYVLFTSDRTQVQNLYAYDVGNGQSYQVTNALTGAQAAKVSPDGSQIAFTGYSSKGYDVHLMGLDRDQWTPVTFDVDAIPAWEGFPTSDYEVHPYDPMPSLMPKLWFPVFNGPQLGITTNGTDALFAQTYNFSGGWDLDAQEPWFDFFYNTTSLLPTFTMFGGMSGGGYYAGSNVGYPLVASNTLNMNVSAGYQRSEFEQLSETYSANFGMNSGRAFDLFNDQFNLSLSAALNVIEGLDPIQRVTTTWQDTLRLPLETPNFISLRFAGGWSDAVEPQFGFALGGLQGPFSVRGFDRGVQAGKLAAAASIAFNHRITQIEKGVSLWPLFLDDLNGSLFMDAGVAGDALSLEGVQLSYGAELGLDFNLSYFGGPTLRVGVAHGLGQEMPTLYVALGQAILASW